MELNLFCEQTTCNLKVKEDFTVKVEKSLKIMKMAGEMAAEMKQPVEICYSGGKDSDVILQLARMAKINYRAIYKNTTIDPPGTLSHVREQGVEIVQPKKTFFQVIREKGFPTFYRRFCCEIMKEYKILDVAVQGIRRSESQKRARRYSENDPIICRMYRYKKEHVNVVLPILSWTDKDIERFIKEQGIKCHPIYYNENGDFDVTRRLGCMGCPLPNDRSLPDFVKNPALVRAWIRNGQIWWNTHKITKTKRKFNNIYELFVYNLFFRNYKDFKLFRDSSLFEAIDCKAKLEEYFKTTLKE